MTTHHRRTHSRGTVSRAALWDAESATDGLSEVQFLIPSFAMGKDRNTKEKLYFLMGESHLTPQPHGWRKIWGQSVEG